LEQAALLHHADPVLFRGNSLDRLMGAVPPDAPARARVMPEFPRDLAEVLEAFHSPGRTVKSDTVVLSGLLLLADALDQQWESLAWEPRAISQAWDEMGELSGLAGEAAWTAFERALRHPFSVSPDRSWDLPVHAPIVREVVASLCHEAACDVAMLARLAARDPVLSGNVLATANSAWFGRRTPCRNLKQALAYIGPETGRRILLALALKPLYGSARLARLWRHAVEMAGYCESLAEMTGFIPPADAMVLGLVHDIGQVALLRHSGRANLALARLEEGGIPILYAEQLLFGTGHPEIGAAILENWGFAPDVVKAVRFQHQPADCKSDAAAALYLAEFWAETDEDLPSTRHLGFAQRRLNCSIERLARVARGKSPLSEILKVA
jgi:HD-like signal output (HDOD) protein